MITFICTAAIFLRYVFISHLVEHLTTKNNPKLVFDGKRAKHQKYKEIRNSLLSAFIFGLGAHGIYELYNQGYIVIYFGSEKSIWYHLLSIVCVLFMHETYYYWLHRAMHSRSLYRLMHKGHHDNIIFYRLAGDHLSGINLLYRWAFNSSSLLLSNIFITFYDSYSDNKSSKYRGISSFFQEYLSI